MKKYLWAGTNDCGKQSPSYLPSNKYPNFGDKGWKYHTEIYQSLEEASIYKWQQIKDIQDVIKELQNIYSQHKNRRCTNEQD